MNNFRYSVLIMIISLLFLNCATSNNNSASNIEDTEQKIKKSFGSFILPDDWIEIKGPPSGNGWYYYFHKSQMREDMPTNICISMTTNPYDKDDPTVLGKAISNLIRMQTGGRASISSSGSYTEQGYPLLIFTIENTEPESIEATSIQFYIVDDKKHILVYLTDFHHAEVTDAEKAARTIVDSFVWAK